MRYADIYTRYAYKMQEGRNYKIKFIQIIDSIIDKQ